METTAEYEQTGTEARDPRSLRVCISCSSTSVPKAFAHTRKAQLSGRSMSASSSLAPECSDHIYDHIYAVRYVRAA